MSSDSGRNVGFHMEAQDVPSPLTTTKRASKGGATYGKPTYAVIGVMEQPGKPPVLSFLYSVQVRPAVNILKAHDSIPIAPADVLDWSYLIVCSPERMERFKASKNVTWK